MVSAENSSEQAGPKKPSRLKRAIGQAAVVVLSYSAVVNSSQAYADFMDDAPMLSQAAATKASILFGEPLDIACNASLPPLTRIPEGTERDFGGWIIGYGLPPFFKVNSNRIHFTTKMCESVLALPEITTGNHPPLNTQQLDVLLEIEHERFHRGKTRHDEAEAECTALQVIPRLLQDNGYDVAAMKPLVDPIVSTAPADYTSRECRIGGKFDLQNTSGTSNAWLNTS